MPTQVTKAGDIEIWWDEQIHTFPKTEKKQTRPSDMGHKMETLQNSGCNSTLRYKSCEGLQGQRDNIY